MIERTINYIYFINLGGDYMNGLMILGVILLIMGFVFVAIEMMIPGFGAHGILGTCCLVAGVVLLSDTFNQALVFAAIILVVLLIMFIVIMSLLSKGKLDSPIILHEKQDKENGYISSNDLNYLLGKVGHASTDLRPTGRGVFDEIEFDVISDGRYISIGSKIEIYKVFNSKLVVREMFK